MKYLNAKLKKLRPMPTKRRSLTKINPRLRIVQEAPPKLLPYWPYDQDTTVYFPW